jgi:hypothetical protein
VSLRNRRAKPCRIGETGSLGSQRSKEERVEGGSAARARSLVSKLGAYRRGECRESTEALPKGEGAEGIKFSRRRNHQGRKESYATKEVQAASSRRQTLHSWGAEGCYLTTSIHALNDEGMTSRRIQNLHHWVDGKI